MSIRVSNDLVWLDLGWGHEGSRKQMRKGVQMARRIRIPNDSDK